MICLTTAIEAVRISEDTSQTSITETILLRSKVRVEVAVIVIIY